MDPISTTFQPSIPQGLKHALPYPNSPWLFSNRLFQEMQKQPFDPAVKFKQCQVMQADKEHAFILRYFMHSKPSNYHIADIICVHNPNITELFISNLALIEEEAEKYKPVLPQDNEYEPRVQTLERWKNLAREFYPLEIQRKERVDTLFRAQVLPLWHGSSEEKCRSISESGFTFFGKHHFFNPDAEKGSMPSTDRGYFGSGIYFTTSAQYASMYSRGHMLLSLVSMRTPYPVVSNVPHPAKCKDMEILEGREGYQNYNAHYIPIASIYPNKPSCMEYYPCYKGQQAAWDELVVFKGPQTLPRFWITLGIDMLKTISPVDLPFQQPVSGFNLEGICKNLPCQANEKKVVVKKGFGEFNVGEEASCSLCPCCNTQVELTDTVILKDCAYSYLAVNQNGGKVEHNVPSLVDTIRLNISGWKFMKINVVKNNPQ